MKALPYEEREKNVFFISPEFKMRIIELRANEKNPLCEMESYVSFYVIKGDAEVTVDKKKKQLKEGNCLVSGPGTFSMQTRNGVRILGIQVFKWTIK